MPPTLQRLIAQGRALMQRFKPQSASVRNVLKLAGGTAGSQVITVAAVPILTRLYGPESFGLLATFASILALLNVVSSLRYELAIAVPEDDDEAIALVWLCFVLVAISTALTALGVALLGNTLLVWLHQPEMKPLLWLFPVGVLLTGVYQPLSYWAIRRKHFGILAQTKFRQTIFGVATNLVLAPLGTIGLFLGQIVSQSAGFISIFRGSAGLLLKAKISLSILKNSVRRYRHFSIYDSPAGLVNAIGSQIPYLVFASSFGASQLGQLALVQRLFLLPAGLISGAVGQVFLSQVSDRYRNGSLDTLIAKASRKLFVYGLLISLLACFVLAPTMPLVFGKEWEPAKQIIPLLVPLFLGQLVVSPLSNAFVGAQKMNLGLVFQCALMALRIIPLLLAASFVSFHQAILIYSACSGLGYSLYLAGIQKYVAKAS